MWRQHRGRQLSTCVLNPTVTCRTKYGTRTTICITPYPGDTIKSLSKPCEQELNIYTKTKCIIVHNLISSISFLHYTGPKLVHLRHISFLSCPIGQARLAKRETVSCLRATFCQDSAAKDLTQLSSLKISVQLATNVILCVRCASAENTYALCSRRLKRNKEKQATIAAPR